MAQFGTIFKFELKYYLKNKDICRYYSVFVLLIAVVMFLPRVMALVSRDDGSEVPYTEREVMLVKVRQPEQAEMFIESFAGVFAGYDVRSTGQDLDEIKEEIAAGNAKCAFILTGATSLHLLCG